MACHGQGRLNTPTVFRSIHFLTKWISCFYSVLRWKNGYLRTSRNSSPYAEVKDAVAITVLWFLILNFGSIDHGRPELYRRLFGVCLNYLSIITASEITWVLSVSSNKFMSLWTTCRKQKPKLEKLKLIIFSLYC